ncbi:MAG TPA: hypothetical protein VF332_10495 [Vicinamibacterales bacterium]|jgi:hypothetical protein
MDLRSLLLPQPRRRLPHARAWNVGARTVHLAATGTLLGGHVFGVPADALLPWLWVAIASGSVMLAVELYTSFDWLTQLGGLAVVLKLVVLAVIPFAWSARVPMLFLVVVIAGVGSHMPGKYRHYSLLYGRSMKETR